MKKVLLLFILTCMSAGLFASEQLVYRSKYLPRPDTVLVFKPKQYDKAQKLPTIFLLHGYSGDYKQWDNIMNAQRYADEYGFIIVCPDGLFNCWYLNSPAKPEMQFESFFFNELFPDIKQKFKVDAQNVFISGLSMGGHGALYLFLKHPELFRSAGSSSGAVDLSFSSNKYGIINLLGKTADDEALWRSYSVIGNINKLAGTDRQIIFDCGVDDQFYTINNELRKKCDELKIKATYITQPGGHNRNYWTVAIRQHFDFYKTLLK